MKTQSKTATFFDKGNDLVSLNKTEKINSFEGEKKNKERLCLGP